MKNNGILSALETLSKITTTYSKLIDFNASTFDSLKYSAKMMNPILPNIENIVARHAELLKSVNIPNYDEIIKTNALTAQWDVLSKIAFSAVTPQLETLQNSLIQNNISGVYAFLDSFNDKYVSACNLSVLKTAKIFNSIEYALPKGLPTIIRDLHMNTARQLSNVQELFLDIPRRVFYLNDDPEEKIDIEEANLVCSSMKLLSGISEIELIKFLNYLDEQPNLALNNETGKQILEIVKNWDAFIDFDYDFFYHARALKDIAKPYNENELRKAPKGVTWHGRFNHVGQSHYYFSNEEKGAKFEVAKHVTDEKYVQIAKMKPTKNIKMVDLSVELTEKNMFLDYCRMSLPKNDFKVKREYLLPCFFADCCKAQGIQGIKYYGSKEYKNYVSWNDTYFDYVDSNVQTLK